MKDLIEALTIMLKYGNPHAPTSCGNATLEISLDIDPESVSADDLKRLEELDFFPGSQEEHEGGFISYRFGQC